ncbi:MAG: class I tRNA ligase family protein, partial [Mycoplasmoidaceae bacterium]|nr:class I tRNA ligase family protein [Mycoplasmoidaceae bacterium]
PPYANGNIHVGHSLNKIIKDIIVRHKTLQQFYSPYIAGWDTHGLPIEHALLKKGVNKDPSLSVAQKRKNCRDFAIQNVHNQLTQFKRLGLLTDFQDIYLTLDKDFETRQLELFRAIVSKKLAYQDLKPIY